MLNQTISKKYHDEERQGEPLLLEDSLKNADRKLYIHWIPLRPA